MSADTLTSVRPEEELLLCCARVSLEEGRAERIRILLKEKIDWDYLLKMAQWHGVVALLYWNLKTTGADAVPSAIMARLGRFFEENARSNLFATGELYRLLGQFEAGGVPTIPLKGPLLATSVYKNLGLRQFSDLDILIREQDVKNAIGVAVASGYQPRLGSNSARQRSILSTDCEYVLVRGESGNMDHTYLEIHWRFVPKMFSFPLNADSLWDRLVPVTLAGRPVRTLSPEDLLLVICVHSAKHLWRQLKWACDVAELVRCTPEMKWDLLGQRAAELGCTRMLLLGLFLAEELLGAKLPTEVREKAHADPTVRWLGAQVYKVIFRNAETMIEGHLRGLPGHGASGYFDRSRFYLKAMERLQDRLRYCVHFATTPTEEDWEAVKIPDSLFALYYVVRPVRLVGWLCRWLWRRAFREPGPAVHWPGAAEDRVG